MSVCDVCVMYVLGVHWYVKKRCLDQQMNLVSFLLFTKERNIPPPEKNEKTKKM
jgi:hypothetical protein